MPKPPRILAFSGSTRRESLNRKLLAIAVEETRAAGGEVTLLDLNDYAMPLYNGDLEDREGLPATAARLVEAIAAHQALLVASPEYNSFITPLLKNTLDWCSRPDANPFAGKVAAVISASPGAYGGIRSAAMARQLLEQLGCTAIPAQCNLALAGEAFDETGKLKNPRTLKSLQKLAASLVQITAKLSA